MQQQLADRIRMARRACGLSQSKIAGLLFVHRGTVGHWERGSGHQPTSFNLQQLSVVMEVSYEWLATGRGAMQLSSEEVSAVRLDCFAQSEAEEQLLLAFRMVPERRRLAVMDYAQSLMQQPLALVTKPAVAAPAPSASGLHSTLSFLKPRSSGAGG